MNRRIRTTLLLTLCGTGLIGTVLGGGLERLPLAPPVMSGPVLSVAAGNDAQGRLVIAWTSRSAGTEQAHVARLGGQTWTPLGGVVNENAGYSATQLSLYAAPETGGDSVWLGWSEGSGLAHIDSYLLARWTGGAWSSPAPYALRRNLSDAGRSRAFTLDPGSEPLVAWTDISVRVGSGAARYPSVVILKTWQPGTQLWRSGAPLNVSLPTPAFMPSVAQHRGTVSVAYVEGPVTQSDVRVRQYSGQRWISLGGPLNVKARSYVFGPKLRLDAQGRPVVAWLEDRQGLDALYVSRWTGADWTRLGSPAVGSAALGSAAVGSALSTPNVSAASVALALTPAGEPVVAWTEGPDGARLPRAARWQAGEWQPLRLSAHRRGSDADSTSVAATSRGVLVAWRELEGGRWRLRTQIF